MNDNSLKSAAPYIGGAIGAAFFGPIGGVIGAMIGKGMVTEADDYSDYSGEHHSDPGTSLSSSDFNSYSDPQSFTDFFNF